MTRNACSTVRKRGNDLAIFGDRSPDAGFCSIIWRFKRNLKKERTALTFFFIVLAWLEPNRLDKNPLKATISSLPASAGSPSSRT